MGDLETDTPAWQCVMEGGWNYMHRSTFRTKSGPRVRTNSEDKDPMGVDSDGKWLRTRDRLQWQQVFLGMQETPGALEHGYPRDMEDQTCDLGTDT